VIERKDGSRPEPPPRPERYNQIRTASARPPSASISTPTNKPSPSPASAPAVPVVPAAAAVATSKLDINAQPPYNGTPINKIPMESDLLPTDKPWRKPGADVTDYFNYGFDEFTWTAYCQKQEGLREEFSPQKMMEQMMLMSGMGMGMGLPGMDPTQMGDMGAMMGGFGMQQPQGGPGPGGPGGGPPQGPGAAQQGAQGMDMMSDPSMYMGGQGFGGGGPQDGGAYGMGRGGV
jgi:pre-mRNA 3'-end-processing factor FIP1